MKVTEFTDIEIGMGVKVIASHLGFQDRAASLDLYVGEEGTVNRKDSLEINIKFPDNLKWWYPPYSLKFPNDDDPINIKTAIIGGEYTIMHELSTFNYDIYDDRFLLPDISTFNFIPPRFFNRGDEVKVIKVIQIRPSYNDSLAFCSSDGGKSNTIVPLSCLYGKGTPQYKPRKFVYEYNQWKNK